VLFDALHATQAADDGRPAPLARLAHFRLPGRRGSDDKFGGPAPVWMAFLRWWMRASGRLTLMRRWHRLSTMVISSGVVDTV
jgi:hypothetical protein